MIAFLSGENMPISPSVLMLLVGVVLMSISTIHRRSGYELSKVKSILFVFCGTAVGVFGAKLLYCIEALDNILANGFSLGGVSFFGAVFLIPPIMLILGPLFQLRPKHTLDLCATNVAIMIACMRLGCFFNGCCGGHRVTLWDINFAIPAQLIEVAFDIWIFYILIKHEEHQPAVGSGYPIFLISYGSIRFLLEFVRVSEKDWLGLSHGQWFSIISVLLGGIALWKLKRAVIRGD